MCGLCVVGTSFPRDDVETRALSVRVEKLGVHAAQRRHDHESSRAGSSRAEPSMAEWDRLARVFRDATCHGASGACIFLFLALPRRDRLLFVRVDARCPRLTGDSASGRIPPAAKVPKNEV